MKPTKVSGRGLAEHLSRVTAAHARAHEEQREKSLALSEARRETIESQETAGANGESETGDGETTDAGG